MLKVAGYSDLEILSRRKGASPMSAKEAVPMALLIAAAAFLLVAYGGFLVR